MGCLASRPSVHVEKSPPRAGCSSGFSHRAAKVTPNRPALHHTRMPAARLPCVTAASREAPPQRSGSRDSYFSILFIYNLQMQSISEYIPSVKHSCIKNRAGEIAWPVNHLLWKHEDLKADPQYPEVSSLGR